MILTCVNRWTICVITTLALLCYGVLNINKQFDTTFNINDWFNYGFGQLKSRAMVTNGDGRDGDGRDLGLLGSVLLANFPQLVLSFLYFFLNSVITSMVLAQEWSDYAYKLKPIRVSYPKLGQRSTYFLQLPYRYGAPLLILSALLHFLISESIFLAQVQYFNERGEIMKFAANAVSTCGWSPLGVAITVIVAVLVLSVVIILGYRRHKPGIPLAGSCSLAIAAACHVPDGTDTTAPMKWGAVKPSSMTEFDGSGKFGHCAFSNLDAPLPEDGKIYY